MITPHVPAEGSVEQALDRLEFAIDHGGRFAGNGPAACEAVFYSLRRMLHDLKDAMSAEAATGVSALALVAADLMRLPVKGEVSAQYPLGREALAEVGAVFDASTGTHVIPGPVGLTRMASDGERRDGRTGWTPGAQ